MKKSNSIIRNIMLTAALSLIHNNEGFADTNIGGSSPNPLNDFLKNNIKRRLFKKVLSIKKGGIIRVINQHTSHSSHSSHSSHYSSSTGNNGSTSSQDYSTNSVYTAGGVVRGENGKKQFAPVSSNKDAALYKLGDRTLSLGLFGNDVKELADYLISIKLMKKEMIEKTQGYIKYNKAIEESVKVFQAKNKLRQTGKVDTNLAVMINKKIREQKNTK
jgi:hypothetical protein